MKVKVLSSFVDKYNRRIGYEVGQVIEWDDQERIADCQARGLIEVVKEADKEEKPKKKTTKKAKQA